MIERWTITGREEWLSRRRPNINGSEIGALFGDKEAWTTRYKLYAEKSGLVEAEPVASDVMERGLIMEPAVAVATKLERPDWEITKATDYLWSPEWRLGCTPDFEVLCPKRGRGVLQAKSSGIREFEAGWADGPPLWILLQTLLEMMLSEVEWGAIGVLIMHNVYKTERRVYEFERHAAAEKRMIEVSAAFWADVEAGRMPAADYTLDGDTIKAIYRRDDGPALDLSRDNRLPELLARREELLALGKHAEEHLEPILAEIRDKLGASAYATLPGWEITNKLQHRKEKVTKASSFRVLRIKRTEAKEQAA